MATTIKACYRAGGELAKQDIPCNPNATVSTCCGADSICMENFYCQNSGGSHIPGTCTDQLWGIQVKPTPECPCLPHYKPDGSTLSYKDSVTLCPDGSICCGITNFECCNSGKGNPRIQFNNSKVIPSGTANLSSYYAELSVTTLPVTRSMTSTSTPTPTSIAMGDATTSSSLSMSVRVGIGVAIGIIVLLFMATLIITIFIWKRYMKLKANRPAEQERQQRTWSPTILGRYEVPGQESKIMPMPVPMPAYDRRVWYRNSRPAELAVERDMKERSHDPAGVIWI